MAWSEILHIAAAGLSFAGVVVGFVTWLFTRHVKSLEKQRQKAEDERDDIAEKLERARLTQEKAEGERDILQKQLDRAQPSLEKLSQYRAAYRDLKERNEELVDQHEVFDAIKAKLQKRLESAETEAAKLRREHQEWQLAKLQAAAEHQAQAHSTANDAARIQQLTLALKENQKTMADGETKAENDREAIRKLESELALAVASLDQAKTERFELRSQLTQLEAQLDGAVEKTGRVWEKPVKADAPAFVPWKARRAPVISIINLKGGVGKTTLTANIGAMLGLHGKRVLLVDLDYQRSLSLMCCSYDDIRQLHTSGRCFQHFLHHSQPDSAKLISCMFPIKSADGCEIIATSEDQKGNDSVATLEDAEMRLMAKWLLGQGCDVRMHLRRALHSPQLQERFDFILLDCPPRFSTTCVNALAASDFALVPVLLDRPSAVSAPNLLRKLKRLRDCGVTPRLEILGIVANRVKLIRGELTKAQAAIWDDIRVPCQLAWGDEVHTFEAKIKESSGFAEAAERHDQKRTSGTFAAFQDELKPLFTDLVEEIEERLAHERSRLAAVSA